MSDTDSAFKEAGDALYAARQALEKAVRIAGCDNSATGTDYLGVMRRLAVYVAVADGVFTMTECQAIQHIFWLDPNVADVWSLGSLVTEDPAIASAALDSLDAFGLLLSSDPAHNEVLIAAETVFQTVLAADGSTEPEVSRLTEVTTRLRQAIIAAGPDVEDPAPQSSSGGAVVNDGVTRLAATMASLDRLVGLDEVKRQVATLTNLAKIFALRRRMDLPIPPLSFHLVFVGNPGSGKTTVARIIAEVYGELGLLSKGHLVEVDRSSLAASYIGQTAIKVQGVIEQSLGGVLFIDEAYALDGGAAQDFGHEAVSTLIKAMEDHRTDLVVIAAGYTEEMGRFLQMNPGLRSRMNRDLTFDDYTPSEMVAIFERMAVQAGYDLAGDCQPILVRIFQELWDARGKDFANARDVRNVFERAIEAQANRLSALMDPPKAAVSLIITQDLIAAAQAQLGS